MIDFWIINTISYLLVLGAAVWFVSGKFNLKSLQPIFFCLWTYYTVCVPLDLALGLGVRVVLGLPDLNLSDNAPYISTIFFHYILFGVGFFLIYNILPGKVPAVLSWKIPKLYLPPLWFIFAANILVFLFYVSLFGGMIREERALVSNQDALLKFFTILVSLIKALDMVYIHAVDNKKKAFWTVVISILFTISSGGRTAIVLFALLYIVRYQINFSRIGALAASGCFILFALFWKIGWSAGQVLLNTGEFPTNISLVEFGLSRFEGVGPYEISVDLMLKHGASPLLMGYSYLAMPFEILFPRFLSFQPMQSLSEYYGAIFRPEFTARGGGMGFSAVGEAWLNFSHIGPLLVGSVVGVIFKYFDTNVRGLSYWIVLFIAFRFFRTDAASLFKSWVVIQGGTLLIVVLILMLAKDLGKRVDKAKIAAGKDHFPNDKLI